MTDKKIIKKSITLDDGRTIEIETGRLARQADGAVVLRMGNAMLLATVVSSKEAKEGVDFLPLTVNYQEQYASAGRFPGGFFKREGRLSDYEIIISRLVDRALRPLFPSDYHADTQVLLSLISADDDVMPDCLAGLAASAALSVSDIPFAGPISEVRVSRIDGEFKINPSASENERADIDLIVAGSADDVNMVEGEMNEVSEQEMLEAIKVAHEAIKKQCAMQKELESETGNTEKREFSHEENDEELKQKVHDHFYNDLYDLAQQPSSKQERSEAFSKLLDDYIEELGEEDEELIPLIKKYYGDAKKEAVRNFILDKRKRIDGRELDEIRPINVEVDYLPSPHGSAVFTRGETQSLVTVTLGSKLDQQTIDRVLYEGSEKFLLHYNFPPFSTGETRPLRGPGRREIGHGNLAERSLRKVLPGMEDNPYTIRIVSDIMESNGSSSMATVCGGSLALMDAGIRIKSGVSGIAMGLISDNESGKYAVLSDILGDEDHLGDMDFKVAGTKDGITACQMDLKVEGLSYDVLAEALEQSKRGRLHILDKMNEVISEARSAFKDHVPRIERFMIDKEFIGAIIGPGGKNIQQIQADTDSTISIEEEGDKGIVEIMAANADSLNKAKARIDGIIEIPEVGKTYMGTVKSIMNFGAFVEFLPGKDGLLHISEIAWEKTDSMEGIFKEGDQIEVQLKSIDPKSGKYALSRKSLLSKPDWWTEEDEEREKRRNEKGGRDNKRGGGNRDRNRRR